jgi:hypothetical protein
LDTTPAEVRKRTNDNRGEAILKGKSFKCLVLKMLGPGMVVYTYNPRYMEGGREGRTMIMAVV